LEAAETNRPDPDAPIPMWTNSDIFLDTSIREPALSAASQAGWSTTSTSHCLGACSPLLFATAELSLTQIGVLVALYPGVWGVGQLITGEASDRYGRKPFITSGMAIQAVGLVVIALRGFPD